MKNFIKSLTCVIVCIISLLLVVFLSFLYIYSLHNQVNGTFFYVFEFFVGLFILISIILSFAYIKIPIDDWFSDTDSDIMSLKNRIILTVSVIFVVLCGIIFVFTIIYNNLTEHIATDLDNMRLSSLLLIMFNTFVSYAYYQNYQALK